MHAAPRGSDRISRPMVDEVRTRKGAAAGAWPCRVSGEHAGKEAQSEPARRRERLPAAYGRAGGRGRIIRPPADPAAPWPPCGGRASVMQRRAALGPPRRAPGLPRGAVPARQKRRTDGGRARGGSPAPMRSGRGKGPLRGTACRAQAARGARRQAGRRMMSMLRGTV